jgi:hypothetical protein
MTCRRRAPGSSSRFERCAIQRMLFVGPRSPREDTYPHGIRCIPIARKPNVVPSGNARHPSSDLPSWRTSRGIGLRGSRGLRSVRGRQSFTLSSMRLVFSAATFVVAVLLCVAVFGCSDETNPSEHVDDPSCIDRPFRAALHVDADDSRRVWATDFEAGRDVAVRPRPPDQFTFDPARPTVLFNADGDVVSFSGEITVSGCLNPATGTLYIGPSRPARPEPRRGLIEAIAFVPALTEDPGHGKNGRPAYHARTSVSGVGFPCPSGGASSIAASRFPEVEHRCREAALTGSTSPRHLPLRSRSCLGCRCRPR